MGYVLVPMLCVGTHHMGALRPGSNNTDWTQSVQPFGPPWRDVLESADMVYGVLDARISRLSL